MIFTKIKLSIASIIFCCLLFAACTQTDTSSNVNAANSVVNDAAPAASPSVVSTQTQMSSPAPIPSPAAELVPTPTNSANPTSNSSSAISQTPPPAVKSSGAADFFVFTAARGAMNDDDELKNELITVDVKNGVVILTGSVTNQTKKARAEQLARQTKDATAVKNLLQITPKR